MIVPPPPSKVKRKRRKSKKTKIEQCLICGKDIVVQNSRKGRKLFCSRECHHQAMRHGAEINCSICERRFWLRQSHLDNGVTTCSVECAEQNRAEKIKVLSLDNIWAKIIKHRAGWKCEYCDSIKRLNAHHIYSRGVWPVRWDLDNGICLCVKHHILGAKSAHKSPLLFADWIREQRGNIWNERLLDKVKSGEKPNKAWEYFHLISEIEKFEQLDNSENFDINDWDWSVAPRTSIIECPIDSDTSKIATHSA